MLPDPARMPALALALLLAGVAAAQGGRLVGKVIDAKGEPVEGAYVQATVQGGSEPRPGALRSVVAQARSDGNGRYALDAPAGLLVFTVTARGYYVISAGGLESETITKTCPEQGPCGELDFRVGKHAVVEGWLADRFGDPVAGVPMTLRAVDARQPTDPESYARAYRAPAVTDDRGYFRMWDVRPGEYILQQDNELQMFPDFLGKLDIPAQRIVIREPGEVAGVRLSASPGGGSHTVSGVVEGAPEQAMFQLLTKSAAGAIGLMSGHPMREGRFSIPGLSTGDYVFRIAEFDSAKGWERIRLLGEFHVDRDLTDLRLTPQPPAGIQLRADFGGAAESNLYVRLRPNGAGVTESITLRGPEYSSTNEGLTPGEYTLTLPVSDYYIISPTRITVQAGQVTPYTLRVGNEFASLKGRVRIAEGAERQGAAHFTVGVRGAQARKKMQADEDGRFVFDKLPPGEYEVAAWSKPDVEVESDDVWADAAGSVNKVQLEPGFDVEINLTAAP